MPLFRALAKNMAASYFGESALRFCNGSYTSVCLYSVSRVTGHRSRFTGHGSQVADHRSRFIHTVHTKMFTLYTLGKIIELF
jgi:hypothetical protein